MKCELTKTPSPKEKSNNTTYQSKQGIEMKFCCAFLTELDLGYKYDLR